MGKDGNIGIDISAKCVTFHRFFRIASAAHTNHVLTLRLNGWLSDVDAVTQQPTLLGTSSISSFRLATA